MKDKIHLSLGEGLIIEGITLTGDTFRPSDWAERLCGVLSTFKQNRISYSPLLVPTVQNGHKCVRIDDSLKISNPSLYTHLLEFAEENHLKTCKAPKEQDKPST